MARHLKAKFHCASWFEAGGRQVQSLTATSFEPASVMEFGFRPQAALSAAGIIRDRQSGCLTTHRLREVRTLRRVHEEKGEGKEEENP